MDFAQPRFLKISLEKQGPEKLLKQNFPPRFGRYYEIRTRELEFCFTLNGEIKSIRGRSFKKRRRPQKTKRHFRWQTVLRVLRGSLAVYHF